MVNAPTTAILQNRERRAFREVIANLMVFDEKGVEIQFSNPLAEFHGFSRG